jgi:hypothetical protein
MTPWGEAFTFPGDTALVGDGGATVVLGHIDAEDDLQVVSATASSSSTCYEN